MPQHQVCGIQYFYYTHSGSCSWKVCRPI